MKYFFRFFLVLLLFTFFIVNCKKDSDDNKNLLYSLLYLYLQVPKVSISGKLPLSSNFTRDSRSIADATDIIIYGNNGRFYKSKFNKLDQFSMTVPKKNTYSILFTKGSELLGSYKIEQFESDSLLTDNYSSSKLNLGELQVSNLNVTSVSRDVDTNYQEKSQISEGTLNTYGKLDNNLRYIQSVDLDSNGVLDLDERGKRANVILKKEWQSSIVIQNELKQVINTFPNLNLVIGQNYTKGYIFTISDTFNLPSNVILTHPPDSNLATQTTVNQLTDKSTMYDGLTNQWIPASMYNFGLNSSINMNGDYILSGGGKTITFKDLRPTDLDPNGLSFISYKLNASNTKINSIDFQWKKLVGNQFVDTTTKDLDSLFGSSTTITYAAIICFNDTNFATMSMRCQVPRNSTEGTIRTSSCNLYQGTPFTNKIKICQAFLKDRFENSYGYTLKDLP